MSLTPRDEPSLKVPCSDTTDTETTADPEAETMNDDRAGASCDVVATLCRMSLVRNQSLSVNGAYVRTPPETA